MAESPVGLSGTVPACTVASPIISTAPPPPIPTMVPITTTSPAVVNIQTQHQKRRSSTRSIKRKKFDDELVESSLVKSDRGRLKTAPMTPIPVMVSTPPLVPPTPPPAVPTTSATIVAPPAVFAAVSGVPPTPTPPVVSATTTPSAPVEIKIEPKTPEMTPTLPPPEKKKNTGQKPPSTKTSSSKRSKKSKPPPPAASTKDLGRWKPQDDLSLITAVQQTNDLTAVHLGVSFSCKFTLKEIQERWYALLYDPVLSKLAINAIKQLHPDVIAAEQARALFSKEEEALLGKITSASQPTLEVFDEVVCKNPTVFHPARTAKILYSHWLLMKQYHLLPDQTVQPMPRGDHVLNFSDAEDMINDDELKDPKDEILEHELIVADRRQKREIRTLEQELPKWQVLVDSVTGISPPDFDTQTLAVLRGRLVRYLMRSREITLGRATKDNPIDVDLSLEGPAWKISRRQGVIKLRSNGDFFIANEGKRPVYIDGKPVLSGNKQKLNNNSVVEISCLRFIFLINQDLIGIIRNEAQKMGT